MRTAQELAELVEHVAGPRARRDRHPATRTFQALRIAVNRELDHVQRALTTTFPACLAPGGILAVISFHSLEDRFVKLFFRRHASVDPVYAGLPDVPPGARPTLRLVGKAQKPSAHESALNPRARSARLRIAERLAA